ncbi:hypothetical protein AVEN_50905-1 [Araneus ventricosus]|uniref:Uncharacterized protein n=1 Tax=Araneus ventricosus TaxID=182803 RepID=A0A4Y2DWA0_ARAVE|nr:hypothetical protein AVEN_50905-1 [Araneus ventricosus]
MKSNETLNAITFLKADSKSIQIVITKDDESDLLEVPNYEKRKIKNPANNNVKPLNGRDKVKKVKLNSSEIGENLPKDKLTLCTLRRNETHLDDQLDLITSVRAESAHNLCERHLANEQGFEFYRELHSCDPGDLVLCDWPNQCDSKLTPMFKGPLMIVLPIGDVFY